MPLHKSTPLNNPSLALEASRVIYDGPCTLFSITAVNTHTADLYLQLFDAASLPDDGTLVNADIWLVRAGGGIGGQDYGELGKRFRTGLVAVFSSTAATKTIAGSVGLFFARYRPV